MENQELKAQLNGAKSVARQKEIENVSDKEHIQRLQSMLRRSDAEAVLVTSSLEEEQKKYRELQAIIRSWTRELEALHDSMSESCRQRADFGKQASEQWFCSGDSFP